MVFPVARVLTLLLCLPGVVFPMIGVYVRGGFWTGFGWSVLGVVLCFVGAAFFWFLGAIRNMSRDFGVDVILLSCAAGVVYFAGAGFIVAAGIGPVMWPGSDWVIDLRSYLYEEGLAVSPVLAKILWIILSIDWVRTGIRFLWFVAVWALGMGYLFLRHELWDLMEDVADLVEESSQD